MENGGAQHKGFRRVARDIDDGIVPAPTVAYLPDRIPPPGRCVIPAPKKLAGFGRALSGLGFAQDGVGPHLLHVHQPFSKISERAGRHLGLVPVAQVQGRVEDARGEAAGGWT